MRSWIVGRLKLVIEFISALRPFVAIAIGLFVVLAVVSVVRGGFGLLHHEEEAAPVDTKSYSPLEKRIARARPGDLIDVAEGVYPISHPMRIRSRGVTLKGAAKGRTVLDFTRQVSGNQALEIAAPDVLIADLTLRNAYGDGIVVANTQRVSLRRIRVDWTSRRQPLPGAVGVHLLHVEDALIDRVDVYGAADAGMYLGQSRQVIVQASVAAASVTGLVIANCEFVDVMRSLFTHNSLGVVVVNLPNLPDAISNSVRILHNRIVDNNLSNAPARDVVLGKLPAGTGIAVIAHDRVAIFDNDISDNPAAGVLIASYLFTGLTYQDPTFDPYAESLHVYNNRFARNGLAPTADTLKLVNSELPPGFGIDIARDGFSDDHKLVNGRVPEALRICLHDNMRGNGAAHFVDLDAIEDYSRPATDARPFACRQPPLREVLITPR